MGKVMFAGCGPGNEAYMVPYTKEAMGNVNIVMGFERFLPLMNKMKEAGQAKKIYVMKHLDEAIFYIEAMIRYGDIAVLVSGDPLFYSLYRTMKEELKQRNIEMAVLPGISSVQAFAAKLGETLENARLLSIHGRSVSELDLVKSIRENETCFFLCSKEQGPSFLGKTIIKYKLKGIRLAAGEKIGYEQEKILWGRPEEFVDKAFDALCVVCVKNENPRKDRKPVLLRDKEFVRGNVPMTKEEIRACIIQRISAGSEDVLWDVGAGTGSVSVELARQCPYGRVYAVEKNAEAIEIIEKNKEKFMLDNLFSVHGQAGTALKNLPDPDRVFLGGTGKELKQILDEIERRKKRVYIVMTAVTLETLGEAIGIFVEREYEEYEISQIIAGRGKEIGAYHVMEMNNPVYILSAATKGL